MVIKKKLEENIYLFTIKSSNIEVSLTNYGASIFSIMAPGRDGRMAEVTLTCGDINSFRKNSIYMGATIGRVANRIPYGRFTLDGRQYALETNSGDSHLHGGSCGFDKKIWDHDIGGDKVTFTYFSPDGEAGYPGNLRVSAAYTLEGDSLMLEYTADSDRATIVNLTNHTYFNLGGHTSGSVLSHTLRVNGGFYLETNENLQPTGQILSVRDTPLDFQDTCVIGKRITQPHTMLINAGGYDFSYLRDIADDFAAEYTDPASGRSLCVSTSLPSIQVYTGNSISNEPGKDGALYNKHGAICLETQFVPDAVNHWYFGPTLLRAGETMRHYTRYSFSTMC